MMEFHVFNRMADGDKPAGLTISKRTKLPPGDFRITEYTWGDVSLWFVARDRFTADERERVYRSIVAIAEAEWSSPPCA